LQEEWIRIVEGYTAMGRTKDSDILVALAGIARLMQKSGLDTYMAGMWKQHLQFELDWRPKRENANSDDDDSSPTHRRPSTYTAPSFSWASVIGPIEWSPDTTGSGGDVKRYCPEFLGASTVPTGADPFGAVSGGYLRVRAPLASASVVMGKNQYRAGPRISIIGLSKPTSEDDLRFQSPIFDIPGGGGDAIANSPIYLLQTMVWVNEERVEWSKSSAMMLRRRHDGTYERIGIVDRLKVGVFEDYGPWTEIIIV